MTAPADSARGTAAAGAGGASTRNEGGASAHDEGGASARHESGASRPIEGDLPTAAPATLDGVASLTARLSACYTGAIHDVLRMMGHDRIVLPPAIKAIQPGTRLAGPIWTVSGHIDRSKTRHDCLLGWCTLLSKAPRGHVVVCQPHNHDVALMGELSAQTLQARGVLGYVVDGGSRDTDLVLAQGFPVFCAFLTPADIVERWIPDRFGEPVTIGDVTVATGDYLLGDRDGVVIIPRAAAEEAVARTEAVMATESEMRRALIGGMDPVDAYHRFGKF